MKTTDAVLMLSALGQGTRFEAFRALVQREPRGIAASDLAELLEVPQQALSAHLMVLTLAGLVVARRNGGDIVYHAEMSRLRDVLQFLMPEFGMDRTQMFGPMGAKLPPQDTAISKFA